MSAPEREGEKGSRNGDGWIDGRLNPTGGTWGKGGSDTEGEMIATVNGMESSSPLSHQNVTEGPKQKSSAILGTRFVILFGPN